MLFSVLNGPSSRTHLFTFTLIATLLCIAGSPAVVAQEQAAEPLTSEEPRNDEVAFDTDRGIWVFDSDGDTWPDLTEELSGTDIYDAADYPGSELLQNLPAALLDFPTNNCRSPFFSQQGLRLCISPVKNAATYRFASASCSVIGGRVCDFEDLYYIYQQTGNDANFNPNGKWLGQITGDSRVLCGNRSVTFNNDPDINNFDGECSAGGVRTYWCCHSKIH